MKKLFEEKFFGIATKIANQRHLLAVRDGLVLAMPLLIVGSLFIIIGDFPLDAYQNFMMGLLGEGWSDFVWNDVFPATVNLLALIAVFGIAKSLVDSYEVDGMPAGVIALAAFFLINTMDAEAWAWNADLFGSGNLFVGMIVALLSGELYRVIVQKKLVIKLPGSVPPSVSRAFTSLVPALAILVSALVIKLLFRLTPFGDLPTFITEMVKAPLTLAGTSYPGSALAVLMEQLLWSLGIHGSSIVTSVMEPIWLNANLENLAAFQAGLPLPHIITQTFIENLLWIGGSGTTLPVVVYMLIFAKSKTLKQVGRLSIAPGLFNINEPVVFGLPIVMNPFLMIPFILSPLVVLTISYFGMFLNIFPRMAGLTIPWTTPYLISGYLATGAHIGGVILQILNFVVAFLIWLPFIRSWDKRNLIMEAQEVAV
ncbi:Cellobiose permease IIC component [uncultured Eubacteriales bacterium]|uniref:Permease IIC component n=1 Tax=uncultured Eubacteriales bacterium TaxID=172733 RepID=A0A212IZ45_9FIRM|nr:Cellobiose permease IIC component [uncultured Eubacteriales bacterium]